MWPTASAARPAATVPAVPIVPKISMQPIGSFGKVQAVPMQLAPSVIPQTPSVIPQIHSNPASMGFPIAQALSSPLSRPSSAETIRVEQLPAPPMTYSQMLPMPMQAPPVAKSSTLVRSSYPSYYTAGVLPPSVPSLPSVPSMVVPAPMVPSAPVSGMMPGVAMLTAVAKAGGQALEVSNTHGFQPGQEVVVGLGTPQQEGSEIETMGTSILLKRPLKNEHSVGAMISVVAKGAPPSLQQLPQTPLPSMGILTVGPQGPPPIGTQYGKPPGPLQPIGTQYGSGPMSGSLRVSQSPWAPGYGAPSPMGSINSKAGPLPVPAYWMDSAMDQLFERSHPKPDPSAWPDESRYFVMEHMEWGHVQGRVCSTEERAWKAFNEMVGYDSKGNFFDDRNKDHVAMKYLHERTEKPVLLCDIHFREIAYSGFRDPQVQADFRSWWSKAVGNPSEEYRPQPEYLPYYSVMPQAIWCDKIIVMLWPHIVRFGLSKVTQKLGDIFKTKLEQPVPKTLLKGLEKMEDKMIPNPVRLPISYLWIQSVIDDVWELVTPAVNDTLPNVILPMIAKKLPGPLKVISLNPCLIGKTTPKITKMTTDIVKRKTGERDVEKGRNTIMEKTSLYLTIDLEYNSEIDIQVHGPLYMKLGAKAIKFRCKIHLCLMDLVDTIPLFTGFRIFMYEPFHFSLDFTGMLDFMDGDNIEKELHEKIHNIAGGILYFPNMISKVLNKYVEGDAALDVTSPRPVGILRIRVMSATGLRGDDFTFSSLWTGKRKSDAKAELRIGGDLYESPVKTTSDGNVTWNEEDYYFLIYEPQFQTLDVDIVDADAVGDDPLARRHRIPLTELMGLPNNDEGWELMAREPHNRHMYMPLHVVWTKKAAPDGKVEQSKNEMSARAAEQNPDTHDHPSFMEKISKMASSVYHHVAKDVSWLEDKFEQATGADPEAWKKLKSKVELFATYRPLQFGGNFRNLQPQEKQLDPVSCCLFVGVIAAHRLPTPSDHEVIPTFQAKVSVRPVLNRKQKVPLIETSSQLLPPSEKKSWNELTQPERNAARTLGWDKAKWDGPIGEADPASEDKKWTDLSEAEQTAATELGWSQASWDEPSTVEEKDQTDDSDDTSQDVVTKAVVKSQVKLALTRGDKNWHQKDDKGETDQAELKRKIKLLQSKNMNNDEIATLLDIPTSYITSEGTEILDYEWAALWEKGWCFLVGNPFEVEVHIEVVKVLPKEGGMIKKMMEAQPEESLGTYVYNVKDLFDHGHGSYTAVKYRKPLAGSDAGAKVSAMFQLLTYTPGPTEGEQKEAKKKEKNEPAKGKGKGTAEALQSMVQPYPGKQAKLVGDGPVLLKSIVAEPERLQPAQPPQVPTASAAPSADATPRNGNAADPPKHENMFQMGLHKFENMLGMGKQEKPVDKKASFSSKMDSAGLKEFTPVMQQHGIDNEEMASSMTDDQLGQLGMKVGHIVKFNSVFKGHDYEIVNPNNLAGIGIPYRATKSESSEVISFAPFGSSVNGIDQGDRWLKVGSRYLPMDVNGSPVIVLKGGGASAAPTVRPLVAAPQPTQEVPEEKDKPEGGFMSTLHKVAHMMHLEKDSDAAPKTSSKSSSKAASSSKATSKAAANISTSVASQASTVAAVPLTS